MATTNLKQIKTTKFDPKKAEDRILYGDLKLALKGKTIWTYNNQSKEWSILYKDYGRTDISKIWESFKGLN